MTFYDISERKQIEQALQPVQADLEQRVEARTAELQTLVTALTVNGAEVIAAASVVEALSALKRVPPDILLSDIGMPNEDGYALIHKVRALEFGQSGKIPAVALTAYTRRQDRERALQAGFQSHLAKPVNPTELVELIASLTGRATSQL